MNGLKSGNVNGVRCNRKNVIGIFSGAMTYFPVFLGGIVSTLPNRGDL